MPLSRPSGQPRDVTMRLWIIFLIDAIDPPRMCRCEPHERRPDAAPRARAALPGGGNAAARLQPGARACTCGFSSLAVGFIAGLLRTGELPLDWGS